HLLAASSDKAPQSAGALSEQAEETQKILVRHFDSTAILDHSRHTECSLTEIPAYSSGDWWLVRLKGLARRSAGKAAISLSAQTNFLAATDPTSGVTCLTRKWGESGSARPNVSKPYLSPWTTHRSLSPDWQDIDLAIPLVPGSFGAPVSE